MGIGRIIALALALDKAYEAVADSLINYSLKAAVQHHLDRNVSLDPAL